VRARYRSSEIFERGLVRESSRDLSGSNVCRFAGLLLVFFFTASRVTRVGEARKRALDPEFKEGGQRNW
jgi:hypothetical protein